MDIAIMQKRHFLVREVDGDYQLKELEEKLADSVNQFTGKHTIIVESIHWIFYFMNCNMTSERAYEIAQQLTQEFLDGKR